MTTYLLAAEADQIQDLLFRSSRLREVVGGSQLLSNFCARVAPDIVARYEGDVVVSDGGAFRLLFHDIGKARECGGALAEAYRRATDGRLSVAEPVPTAGDFSVAHRDAQQQLRLAKQSGDPPDAVAHLPYIVLCASCGRGLAVKRDGDGRYVCGVCDRKATERKKHDGRFLGDFVAAVAQKTHDRTITLPEDADSVASRDPRQYVAYMAADGNSMGVLFGKCDRQQLKDLSDGLSRILQDSLAAACEHLLRRLREDGDEASKLPVLPLILGGDDVFALLPAKWGVDMARRFCTASQDGIRELTLRIGLDYVRPAPSMAAGVVICKAHYPYRLAHDHAKRALRRAKQLSHRTGESSIAFDLVRDSVGTEWTEGRDYLATLGAYAALGGSPGIEGLLQQRVSLAGIPGGRRSQLEKLFENADGDWDERVDGVLRRIARAPADHARVVNALNALGDANASRPKYWKAVGSARGHGLPDLLRLWEFLFDLENPRSAYGEGVRS